MRLCVQVLQDPALARRCAQTLLDLVLMPSRDAWKEEVQDDHHRHHRGTLTRRCAQTLLDQAPMRICAQVLQDPALALLDLMPSRDAWKEEVQDDHHRHLHGTLTRRCAQTLLDLVLMPSCDAWKEEVQDDHHRHLHDTPHENVMVNDDEYSPDAADGAGHTAKVHQGLKWVLDENDVIVSLNVGKHLPPSHGQALVLIPCPHSRFLTVR
jgi:hypothetical protein